MAMPDFAVPSLESERLVMRGHRRSDLEDSAAMWADPMVIRHIKPQPSTAEESWSRLLGFVGHWALFGYGFWVVRDKASGRFVGEVGFGEFKREVEPAALDGTEVGWVLAPWCYGAGFATEAVRAILGWGDRHIDAPKTQCMIAVENLASLRVAEKCGFRQIGSATYHGRPQILLERPRPG